MITRTDALGQVTHYIYTKDNRIASLSYSNTVNPTPSVSFTWDSMYPRIDAMTDGTGKTTFTYVKAGTNGALQLASEAGPEGTPAQYAYTYDALGRISQLTVAGVVQDAATYDAIGRDIADTTPLGTIDTAYLGETGQVTSVTTLAQSISGSPGLASYSYLANTGDRRLSGITFNAAAASNETLTTDDADRILSRIDGTGKTESYSYDLADRLIGGSVTAPTTYSENYGYNAADFIASKSGEATSTNNWTATNTGLVNDIGTLTPTGSTGRPYTYDANGNVLSDGIRTYTWDAENRLLSVKIITTGHLSTFTYDGLSRRVAITETSGTTATTTGYLWCGSSICAAYSGTATTSRYLPESEVRYSGATGTDYFYERDHLGTVTSMTSITGTALGTLATDAYGVTLSQTGTAPTFAYAGMFSHQASGLYLTQYRAYDPYSGRWLSRDPAGEDGGIDLYDYAGSNPQLRFDPTGQIAIVVIWEIAEPVVLGGGRALINVGKFCWEDPETCLDAAEDANKIIEAYEASKQKNCSVTVPVDFDPFEFDQTKWQDPNEFLENGPSPNLWETPDEWLPDPKPDSMPTVGPDPVKWQSPNNWAG
jgi:RHS repeat-associated protein